MLHAYGIGSVLNETYRLERELGRSALGTVYAGSNLSTGGECAIRVFPAEAATMVVERERFLRDHKIVAQLGDPRLPPLSALATTPEGALFLVTELWRGETLQKRLRRGAMAPPAALALLRTLCQILGPAHQRGVPHGDVQPNSILLGDGDQPQLVDLGLHHFRIGPLRVFPRRAPGVGWYVAPEQTESRSREADIRGDVFALGAVFYEALSGHPAFLSPPTIDSVMRGRSGLHNPGLGGDDREAALGLLLERACAARPEDRFKDATELGEALQGLPAEREAAPTPRHDPAAPVSEARTGDSPPSERGEGGQRRNRRRPLVPSPGPLEAADREGPREGPRKSQDDTMGRTAFRLGPNMARTPDAESLRPGAPAGPASEADRPVSGENAASDKPLSPVAARLAALARGDAPRTLPRPGARSSGGSSTTLSRRNSSPPRRPVLLSPRIEVAAAAPSTQAGGESTPDAAVTSGAMAVASAGPAPAVTSGAMAVASAGPEPVASAGPAASSLSASTESTVAVAGIAASAVVDAAAPSAEALAAPTASPPTGDATQLAASAGAAPAAASAPPGTSAAPAATEAGSGTALTSAEGAPAHAGPPPAHAGPPPAHVGPPPTHVGPAPAALLVEAVHSAASQADPKGASHADTAAPGPAPSPSEPAERTAEARRAIAAARVAAAARLMATAQRTAPVETSPPAHVGANPSAPVGGVVAAPVAASPSKKRRAPANLQEQPPAAGEVLAKAPEPPVVAPQQPQIIVDLTDVPLAQRRSTQPYRQVSNPPPLPPGVVPPALLVPAEVPSSDDLLPIDATPELSLPASAGQPAVPQRTEEVDLVLRPASRSPWRAAWAPLLGVVVVLTASYVLARFIAAPQVAPAAHVPAQPGSADLTARLADIDQALDAQDWRLALLRADEVLRTHPDQPGAIERRRRAESELQNQLRYDSFRAASERGNNEAALALYAEISEGSAYRTKAAPLADSIRGDYLTAKLDEARTAQRLNLCDELRRLGRSIRTLDPQNQDIGALEEHCDHSPASPDRSDRRPERSDRSDRAERGDRPNRSDARRSNRGDGGDGSQRGRASSANLHENPSQSERRSSLKDLRDPFSESR